MTTPDGTTPQPAPAPAPAPQPMPAPQPAAPPYAHLSTPHGVQPAPRGRSPLGVAALVTAVAGLVLTELLALMQPFFASGGLIQVLSALSLVALVILLVAAVLAIVALRRDPKGAAAVALGISVLLLITYALNAGILPLLT